MKKLTFSWSLLVILSILLGSCKLPAPSGDTPQETAPDVVFTSAAQTAAARMTEQVSILPSPEPGELGNTPSAPSQSPAQETVPAVIDSPSGSEGDKAEFISDVSVPDGTVFAPGEPFVKTWRMKNVGGTTWTTDYSIYLVAGEAMGAPESMPLPHQVAPGQEIDLSVNMVAPTYHGDEHSNWMFKNAAGERFGVGTSGEQVFWVVVVVEGEAIATATLGPAPEDSAISGMFLSVDNASVSGSCPHTFRFSGIFTLRKATSVTYTLEVGSKDPGLTVKQLPPVTQNLDAGSHNVSYDFEFSDNMNGWARLHFLEPLNAYSNQVNFSLVCQ